MIQALIFDFAGVLGADGYWLWLKENVRNLDRHRDAFHDISVRADRAEISVAEFMEFVGEKTGLPPEVVTGQMLAKVEINRELVDLIEGLKPRYRIGLLSNFVFEWLDDILRTNDLVRLFDTVVISSRVKMVKPEKAVYALACSRLGVAPSETVFIDDRQVHVDAAIACGMKGFVFTDVPSLTAQLRNVGVALACVPS